MTATLTPGKSSWGFLRIFSEETGSDADGDGVLEYAQVGAFDDLPYVTGTLDPPPGEWEIHNTEALGDRGYSSWYSHGIAPSTSPIQRTRCESSSSVPHAGRRFKSAFGPPFPYVWGVAIDPETGIICASDIRSDLWIVKPTGAAAASRARVRARLRHRSRRLDDEALRRGELRVARGEDERRARRLLQDEAGAGGRRREHARDAVAEGPEPRP